MEAYIITQAANITILVAFTLFLVLRTRGEYKQRIRELAAEMPRTAPTLEQRKLELRTKIETLQQELNELDRGQVSALRPKE